MNKPVEGCLELCREILQAVIKRTESYHSFTIEAIFLLPEHVYGEITGRHLNYSPLSLKFKDAYKTLN